MLDLSQARRDLEVHAPVVLGGVRFVPHAADQAPRRRMHHVPPHGQELGIQAPERADLHELSQPPRRTPGRIVHDVSPHRWIVGVSPPERFQLHPVPQPPVRSQAWVLHQLPPRRPLMGVPTPGSVRSVYELPQPPVRSPFRILLGMPPRRPLMGVPTHQRKQVLVVPQGALEPLRQLVQFVPLAKQVVVEGKLLSPTHSRWRTLVQELLLHEMPSERVLFALLQLPRQHYRSRRRLGANQRDHES